MIKRITLWLIKLQWSGNVQAFKDLIAEFLPEYHLAKTRKKKQKEEKHEQGTNSK